MQQNNYYKSIVSGLILSISLLIGSCHQQPQLFNYLVGFSTPSGNEIWVQKVIFDDTWTTPVGNLACCWEESTKSNHIYKRKLPRKLFIRWLDESTQQVFSATIQLIEKLPELANHLPYYTWDVDGKRDKDIFIIIGMRENGEVTVWLSNSQHGENLSGRVLKKIGHAQATSTPWIPPGESKNI